MALVSRSTTSILAFVAGFVAVFYSFYYMEQLSYAIGLGTGIATIASIYNAPIPNVLTSTVTSVSALRVAIDVTYIMLPFSLVMFGIGILWIFSKTHLRITSISLGFASMAFVMLAVLLETNLTFSSGWALGIFSLSYLGAAFGIIAGLMGFREGFRQDARNVTRVIAINPATPYTNMIKLSSKLRLSGSIKILDMHFDAKALENLLRLIGKPSNTYSEVLILTKRDRLGDAFMKGYGDLKQELIGGSVGLDLRIIDEKDALEQHERLLIDSTKAYKIPPINIINKKSEHIVSIDHGQALHRFDELWARATKFENLK